MLNDKRTEVKRDFIEGLIQAKPRFSNFVTMRQDYVWREYKRENIQFSVGVENKGIAARFVLIGPMRKHLEKIAADLEKFVGFPSKEKVWPMHEGEKASKATVKFWFPFDIEDRRVWPNAFDWADDMMDKFESYFIPRRKSFKRGQLA